MSLTPYHAKYYAHELTRRWPSDSVEKFAAALVDARVDLNPHQVAAALFAFKSPLSKGALLADEVGLGKTIEAGLLISQRWAERKRRILVIAPANLRKQWFQEMSEKFFLPCHILEAKSFNAAVKAGKLNPFDTKGNEIVICSYQFAAGKDAQLSSIPWDLVVIDEAHRLRNVWKPDNKTANRLKNALVGCDKVLLTATPLQNSLLELYGLVSFIDDQAFGDAKSFRDQYGLLRDEETFTALKARLAPICHRTLRRQVLNVKFTARHPLVEDFITSQEETDLYDHVTEYLQREHLAALPKGQRALITMVLRKLLASSTFAIAGALEKLIARLQGILDASPLPDLEEELDEDYETLDEAQEEWPEVEAPNSISAEDRAFIQAEINDLKSFRDLAVSITHNAKGKALLAALDRAFAETEKLGGARKAIIFTESRRTQDYLVDLLANHGHADGLLLFNGSNTDERSKRIYNDWIAEHKGTDRVTGSRTADMRSALVDYFRDKGSIMIATEAGAEGINLQFCSLIINYDLPWNPQRIEQRIGRCHRYGQQHDVVVLNFVNRSNEADRRVFELLSEKFKLFDGVFGASDEVLGALESGVDIERRIADIYQKCRNKDEIKEHFDKLQLELDFEIKQQMDKAHKQLIENFDDEVREKLQVSGTRSKANLDRYQRMLMRLSSYELAEYATFNDDRSFTLRAKPFGLDIPLGDYELPQLDPKAHDYRLGTELAKAVLERAKERPTEVADVVFDLSGHNGNISVLKPFKGQQGVMALRLLSIEGARASEDHLLLAGHTAIGETIPPEVLREFFRVDGKVVANTARATASELLTKELAARKAAIQAEVQERNVTFYETEASKLDAWADDQKVALERAIKEYDRQIKEVRRAAMTAPTLAEKIALQEQIGKLERERSNRRRALFLAQDEIDQRRDELIAAIAGRLSQEEREQDLFTIHWSIV